MLEKNFLLWAEQKGILENATLISQSLKLEEEITEFVAEIEKNNSELAKMELGDVLVVCTILCKMLNKDLNKVFVKANTKYIYNRKDTKINTLNNEIEYLLKQVNSQKTDAIIESLGNILLLANMFAISLSTTTTDCMQKAYNKIINRKEKMLNGQFVKDANNN